MLILWSTVNFHGMVPEAGEPVAGPWRAELVENIVQQLRAQSETFAWRPKVVAIDGRGGAGKTTLAERLRAAVPLSVVLHSDDLAWHHSFFGWDELMAGILLSIRRGEAVSFTPPAWRRLGRDGSIYIPSGLQFIWVEGTGTSRRSLSALLDATIWVQADASVAGLRLVSRDGADEEVLRQDWHKEEIRFLLEDQPWYRADLIVAGTPVDGVSAENAIVVADGVPASPRRKSGCHQATSPEAEDGYARPTT
jgi:hypothetical protein